ncbi:23S rRNA (pseudouridine(1915)-N(3))-methyltransferase RlmH [Terrihabitans sp. B22-R8]|uniref:23S rRNA (pseudouridine(1915)-N(3))-methyltransferase RlmH n=1 Tax=Terrihabitans sp. B22-R8 TaxID=3425128 RepID=UPI00403C8754
MRIVVAVVGRLKDGPERELVGRYVERTGGIGRGVALGPVDVRELPESRARRPEDRKRDEAEALCALLEPGAPIVVLDEGGLNLTSADFAARIGRWRDEGAPCLHFVIGGADGLAAELRQRAQLVLAFGGLTWPHGIVRVLLAEQIYRAATILAGHPYHRE